MPAYSGAGLASDVIGREATFVDKFFGLFADIPGVSHLSTWILHKMHMDNDIQSLGPLLSFFLTCAILGFSPKIIKTIIHSWFMFSRAFAKGADASARWATFKEVFSDYTIPSSVSMYGYSYVLVFSSFMIFLYMSGLSVPGWLAVLLPLPVAYYVRALMGPYDDLKKIIQPYPLGSYNGFKLYLIGGRMWWSILRGSGTKEARQGHCIIIGPSGSGKTTKYFIPGLLEDASNNCSAIVVEAKASAQEDMFSMIAPTWIAAGKRVVLFDPWSGNPGEVISGESGPKKKNKKGVIEAEVGEQRVSYKGVGGLSFNPLLGLKASFTDATTRDTIEEIVDAIYRTYETEKGSASGDAAYHVDQEKALVKGLLTIALFKPKGERNLAAVAKVVNSELSDVVSYIKNAMSLTTVDKDEANAIREALIWFISEENLREDNRASMLRGIAGKLAVFYHPRLLPYVTNDEIDLDRVFEEPTLLCIKSPLNVPGASTMASIIIRMLMSRVPNKMALYQKPAIKKLDAAVQKYENLSSEKNKTAVAAARQELKKAAEKAKDFKVFFYLDELPALSVPKFDQFCKTARSSGTGAICAVQDRSDMADIFRAKLGISSIDGLLGNFKTQILLPGLCPSTCEYYSRAFGKTTIRSRRTQRHTKSIVEFGWYNSKEEKLLIEPDAIKFMKETQCIVADMNTRPFFANTIPWYESSHYKNLVSKNQNLLITLTRKPYEEGGPVTFTSAFISRDEDTEQKGGKNKDKSGYREGDKNGAVDSFHNTIENEPADAHRAAESHVQAAIGMEASDGAATPNDHIAGFGGTY